MRGIVRQLTCRTNPRDRALGCLCVGVLLVSALLAADPAASGERSPNATLALEAQCPPVFGDHAVFQQDIPVPVWGRSLPGAKVTVRFAPRPGSGQAEQTKETVAGKDGQWKVALDPMPADKLDSLEVAPGGRTLTIATELDGKKASTSFKDILIGEVWLCAGQSNMAGKMSGWED